jgi:hypothetical protein
MTSKVAATERLENALKHLEGEISLRLNQETHAEGLTEISANGDELMKTIQSAEERISQTIDSIISLLDEGEEIG